MSHADAWALVTKQEEIKRDEISQGSRKQLTTQRQRDTFCDKLEQQLAEVWNFLF
jgi:hypothetical protein